MQAKALEETLQNRPFRPIEIHADGRVIPVDHPEQMYLTPSRSTLIVAMPDERIHVIDTDHISSVTLRQRRRRNHQSPGA